LTPSNDSIGQDRRKSILFVAEAVTLAHVARPLALAQCLDPARYDVHFASAPRYEFALKNTNLRRWTIDSIPTVAFLKALAHGSRLYDYATLERYIDDDLRLIEEVKPDLIVGDFRLSLAVSAAIAKVAYAALANAYWSPYSARDNFPLPDLPVTRLLGYGAGSAVFNLFQPLVFAYHARPLNRLRRRFGLQPLSGLPDAYTHADYVLYADPPDFYPMRDIPPNHRFLGPIDWSPEIPRPSWWQEITGSESLIYATLGSSGAAHLLPALLAALGAVGAPAVVATAARAATTSAPANVRIAEYLPGAEAARRASLVICNGGSPGVYQALAQGTPVLGIASNMDQMLAMGAVEKAQAGILLRSGHATTATITTALKTLTTDASYRESAQKLKERWVSTDSRENFRAFVAEIL
jgi:UDP:flavonoid glycosyltransferase YjiC (YdhE family)